MEYPEIKTIIERVNRDDYEYWAAWAKKHDMDFCVLMTQAISEYLHNHGH